MKYPSCGAETTGNPDLTDEKLEEYWQAAFAILPTLQSLMRSISRSRFGKKKLSI